MEQFWCYTALLIVYVAKGVPQWYTELLGEAVIAIIVMIAVLYHE